ncbi:hypothetical protein [Micromonospora sp. HUAS LYJ1]|uniref:hypothetical protein n=1 Tax=Micromonospora sp. HUAS LYJ1 TaxID=3061626 RepID=UPI002672A5B7|nr:hypothetical protein [Micromonospora sp. HUAS LYJ1]WKU03408.1 hypothetical protein Q2K16_21475 [Micromonospora sp. HUAS LYJ1]
MDSPTCPPDEPEADQSAALTVGDPHLHRTRLLARECATCIFKPGNPMHLEPGRLKEMVTEACGHAGYIVCHSTLPNAGSPIPPAVCRGFADRYRTWQLQVMQQLWGFVEIEPPEPDSTRTHE